MPVYLYRITTRHFEFNIFYPPYKTSIMSQFDINAVLL